MRGIPKSGEHHFHLIFYNYIILIFVIILKYILFLLHYINGKYDDFWLTQAPILSMTLTYLP